LLQPEGERSTRRNLRGMPWYGPALLAALFIVLLVVVLMGSTWRVHQLMTVTVENELANVHETISNRLSGNLDYLALLASERAAGTLSPEEFSDRGRDYVVAHPELINLTWVGADFVIQHVTPLQGNEQILGLSLTLAEPARASGLARETGLPVYTDVFEAIQGSPSFEVWVPVFRNDEFLGLIAGVYSCQQLLPALFSVFGDHPGSLALLSGEQTIIARLGTVPTTVDAITATASLGPAVPALSVRLRRPDEATFSPITLLISGLCGALALAMGWAMWALRRDAETIRDANRFARLNEECFRLLAESAPLSLVLCEAGVVTYANEEAHRLLKSSQADELAGRPWQDFVMEDVPARETDDGVSGEVLGGHRIRCLDASTVDVELNTSQLVLEGRELTQIILRDLTEQQQALDARFHMDAQIQHAQKLESLGVLAGGIAHDFNNLLVGMLGYADLALLTMSSSTPGREYVDEVVKSAQRAAELCNQMLAYSGKGRFVIQSVDLSEIVQEMSHLLEVSISKKVTLRYRFSPTLPAVNVDVTQIRQVVMNLITNASDALGDTNGQITVTTDEVECDAAYLRKIAFEDTLPPGTYVCLEVSDTGCGMDRETIARIFEPFFTSKDTGRGLGLAAVMGIVRGHKGALNVYSEPGKGTTMKVLLPASEGEAISTRDALKAESDWRGEGTILIVDDEEMVVRMTVSLFQRGGYETLTAENGEEAVALYREHQEDIVGVLLDMTMPGMNGEETFTQLRRINPNVRVVLTSGYNEQEVTSSLAGKGLAGFIQKPYRADSLLATFHDILSG